MPETRSTRSRNETERQVEETENQDEQNAAAGTSAAEIPTAGHARPSSGDGSAQVEAATHGEAGSPVDGAGDGPPQNASQGQMPGMVQLPEVTGGATLPDNRPGGAMRQTSRSGTQRDASDESDEDREPARTGRRHANATRGAAEGTTHGDPSEEGLAEPSGGRPATRGLHNPSNRGLDGDDLPTRVVHGSHVNRVSAALERTHIEHPNNESNPVGRSTSFQYAGVIDGVKAKTILAQSLDKLVVEKFDGALHTGTSWYDWSYNFRLKMTLAHLWPFFTGQVKRPHEWALDAEYNSLCLMAFTVLNSSVGVQIQHAIRQFQEKPEPALRAWEYLMDTYQSHDSANQIACRMSSLHS